LTEYRVNDRKVFEKNPRYRAAKDVALSKAVFVAVPDPSRALAMYEAGQIHWLFQVPTDQIERLSARPELLSGPANSVYFYMFNTTRKPLDDPRVRRALSMALEREKIARFVLRGGETPAERLIPPPSR
jgi:oligopeptide transport system substrate-binding protein